MCTPHIAGHSVEAKHAAVELISEKIHQAYNLPLPFVPSFSKRSLPSSPLSWEKILQLYNPFTETQQLKTALDKTEAFMKIRKAHTFRHEFF